MGLLERIASARGETRYSADQWLSDYLLPTVFGYGGNQYLSGALGLRQTLAGNRATEIVATLPGYAQALRNCPPAFAAQMVRALVLSQARFTFRNRPTSGTPRKTFGTRDLGVLERPWPGATTGELIARMEWHAGLAGNAYVVRQPGRLRVLRPDWVALLYGSDQEPDDAAHALDGELIGYVYCNQGFYSGYQPQSILPRDMAHWSPLPAAESVGVGESWITPAVRDIQSDRLYTEHKIKFLENGATPNLVVKGIPALTKPQFDEIVDAMEAKHAGVANAYRTLYLTAGADASVIGADMQQLDFKATQGAGETRIAVLSRVPAPLLGISEGLAGSSLNAGNFGMARRMFADTWMYPTLQDLCAALSTLVKVPADAELWFDTADMPILREDGKDAADIDQVKATAIRTLVDGGFDPDAAIATVAPDWVGKLRHTGNLSVQLQPPGAPPPAARALTGPDDDSRHLPGKHNQMEHGHPGHGAPKSWYLDDDGNKVPFKKPQPTPAAPKPSGSSGWAALAAKAAKKTTPAKATPPPAKKAQPAQRPFKDRVATAAKGEKARKAAPSSLRQPKRPPPLTSPQQTALLAYKDKDYQPINGGLRTPPPTQRAQQRIDRIDSVMAQSPLAEDVAVYRGARNARRMFGDRFDSNLTGVEWREDAYVSTTTDRSVAVDFATDHGYKKFDRSNAVIMRVVVPAGVGGIELSGPGDDEAELLLQRGLRMRVVADRGRADGIRQIDVEVVPDDDR